MRHVKITDHNGKTKNNTQWGEGITHEIIKEGKELCTNQVLHGYYDEYVAVFYNPIHGDYDSETMQLWECEGEVVADDKTKLGFKKQTTLKQIQKPVITMEQRTEIAIRCSMKVYQEESYTKWAQDWISGKDRSISAADSARSAAESAARSASWSASWSAAWSAAESAARSAAWSAARSAAWSAESAAQLSKIIKSVIGEV